MTDPYKVLGISPGATDDEVKKAYRKLSRIYHPDANINNANKDQAEEKFKLVQDAYKQIMHEREYGSQGYSGYGNTGYNTGNGYGGFSGYGGFDGFSGQQTSSDSQETIELRAAENYIRNGYYEQALNVLNNIPSRSARWYYLHAIASSGVGNNINAKEDARRAVQMEPNNFIYRQLLNNLESGGQRYQTRGAEYGRSGGMSSGCCLGFLCLECLCNCCCGV